MIFIRTLYIIISWYLVSYLTTILWCSIVRHCVNCVTQYIIEYYKITHIMHLDAIAPPTVAWKRFGDVGYIFTGYQLQLEYPTTMKVCGTWCIHSSAHQSKALRVTDAWSITHEAPRKSSHWSESCVSNEELVSSGYVKIAIENDH